ncbi:MAG: hypothetical protein JWP67_450, partial [Mucilaginibacter sp.]|nr:hypothetical protein [Mucilaginibacter sp.]
QKRKMELTLIEVNRKDVCNEILDFRLQKIYSIKRQIAVRIN